MIPRKHLLKKLELLEPALADNELDPTLMHYWFTGERVIARNERIAISTPLATTFQRRHSRPVVVSSCRRCQARQTAAP